MTTIIYISYEINIYLTLSMISKARSTPPIKQEVGHSGLPEKDGERGTNRFAWHVHAEQAAVNRPIVARLFA